MHQGPEGFLWYLIVSVVGLTFICIPLVMAWVGLLEIKRQRTLRGIYMLAFSLPLLICAIWALSFVWHK